MAFGLRLARSQGFEGTTGNLNEFNIDPLNDVPIFKGDPVTIKGAAPFNVPAAGANGTIQLAASAAPPGAAVVWDQGITGIFTGCRYVDQGGDYEFMPYWDGAGPLRTKIIAHVALPTTMMYHIEASAPWDPTWVGQRFGFLHDIAGSPQYGDSRARLNAAANPADGAMTVHRLADLPGNDDPALATPIVEVSIRGQQMTASDDT